MSSYSRSFGANENKFLKNNLICHDQVAYAIIEPMHDFVSTFTITMQRYYKTDQLRYKDITKQIQI